MTATKADWPLSLYEEEMRQSGEPAISEAARAKEAYDRLLDLTKDLPYTLAFDIRVTAVAYGTACALGAVERMKAAILQKEPAA